MVFQFSLAGTFFVCVIVNVGKQNLFAEIFGEQLFKYVQPQQKEKDYNIELRLQGKVSR